jgi:hypothetical protein
MTLNSVSASSTATASNPSSPAPNEPVAFTHRGEQYTITHEADGGVSITRGGTTMQFDAGQAADLRGLPTENTLWGASADAPDASFQGVPLEQVFSDPASSPATSAPPERLW